jgi:hypothetical protein
MSVGELVSGDIQASIPLAAIGRAAPEPTIGEWAYRCVLPKLEFKRFAGEAGRSMIVHSKFSLLELAQARDTREVSPGVFAFSTRVNYTMDTP